MGRPRRDAKIDSPLSLAAARQVEERGRLFNPAEARDRCRSESEAFIEILAAFGVEGTIVSGFKTEGNVILAGHFAVRVDNDVWDWTARQFDPFAAVPLVTPWVEWRQQWNPSAGWSEPLNDPVSVVLDLAEQLACASDGNER